MHGENAVFSYVEIELSNHVNSNSKNISIDKSRLLNKDTILTTEEKKSFNER